jgi:predicted TIM-barrel fold metal-dependent hydrolase
MIVDVHSHIMWYPDHIAEEYAAEALASKLVKLEQSGGKAHVGTLDLHSYDSTPEQHWAACSTADRVVVFGLQARATGVWVPNEVVANYIAQHSEKLIGWASVDPTDPGCINELNLSVLELGLRGLKVGPAYQHFDPTDKKYWPLFARCEELDIPVIWHQGTTFPSKAKLRVSTPLLLEDITLAFPALRMIVAHIAHPWETDLLVLMRKAPNLYADISAVHYRPWRYWQTMVTAMEYGVTHKLLLGSDFPSATVDQVIDGLRNINSVAQSPGMPQISEKIQNQIIFQNWKRILPELG